nr:hypothetical protein HUO10_006425 [Paraburkholderia busanensis]
MTSGLNGNVAQESVHAMDFSWGTLVSLNWSELGYAPGGTEYCLLPNDGPAISIGHLRLDWTSVRFREIV